MAPDRTRITEALEKLRRTPFPPAPRSESLADLHVELADYDGHVAGYLTRLQSGQLREIPPNLVDVGLGKSLRAAVEGAAEEGSSAQQLLDYYDNLVRVLGIAGVV